MVVHGGVFAAASKSERTNPFGGSWVILVRGRFLAASRRPTPRVGRVEYLIRSVKGPAHRDLFVRCEALSRDDACNAGQRVAVRIGHINGKATGVLVSRRIHRDLLMDVHVGGK